MTTLLSALQAVGALAVLVGTALLLPLGAALVVDGVIVLVLATALEVAVRRTPSAPSDRRDGTTAPGVE